MLERDVVLAAVASNGVADSDRDFVLAAVASNGASVSPARGGTGLLSCIRSRTTGIRFERWAITGASG